MTDQIPPQALDMEIAVLGSFLNDSSVIDDTSMNVKQSDFYREANGIIFNAIQTVHERREPVDMFTVQEELRKREMFESCGGLQYLKELLLSTATPSNAPHYAKRVRDKSILRKLEKAGKALQSIAHSDYENIETVLSDAEAAFTQATTDAISVSTSEGIRSIISRVFEQIEQWDEKKQLVTGIPTGIEDLDYLTRGWQATDLIMIGARPSQGKTALAAHFAVTAAKAGYPTYIVSQEMSKDRMGLRLIQSSGRVDGHRMRTGHLSPEDWRRVGATCGTVSNFPMTISERALTLAQLRGECRRLARTGLRLVVVDYLQLMKSEGRSNSRNDEVSALAEGLHDLAVELKVSIIALSQLNREVDKRPGHRPMLADLRDSGQVEAAADVVLFPFNPLAYESDEKRLDREEMEIIVAKQRDGMVGSATALWFREYTSFGNIAKDREAPNTDIPTTATTQPQPIHQNGTAPPGPIDSQDRFFSGLEAPQEVER